MKKIFLLASLFASLYSFSQPETNGTSKAITSVDQHKRVKLTFGLPRFADTATANLTANKGLDTAGRLMFTYDGKLWKRIWNPKRWVEIEGGGGSGSVTSVGLTMPSGFTVTGSPVTGSGTLAVTGAGSTSQYIRGNGSLATFPTNLSSFTNGPGYLVSSDLSPYLEATTAATTYVPLTRTINGQSLSSNLTLSTSDISEGSNLYWTNSRFDTRFGLKTTDNLTEGATNLYYTNARARGAVSLSFTTTGTSGAATGTYNSTTGAFTVNIPQYSAGGGGSSYTFNSPLSESAGAVSIQAASAIQGGYLTQANWNTFNDKQAQLNGTGFVKASGTTISYDNSTYYLASNPNSYITATALSPYLTTATAASTYEPIITAGTSLQYYRGDKTFQTLNTSVVPEGSNLYYTSTRFNTAFAAKSTTDLTEGTNLYYTGARFNTAFAAKSTTDLSEGTNLYWTNTRFDTRFDTRLALKSTNDLTEGTNLYYTDARFDTRLAAKSTTNLSEGTNLYYTAARFNTAFSAKSTTDLSEGSNLYYTDTRARAAFTFQNSLTATTGTVNLVNDQTSPGNSKYYGTNSSGTKGFFDVSSSYDSAYVKMRPYVVSTDTLGAIFERKNRGLANDTIAFNLGGGGGSGDALTTGTLAQFSATTSAQLRGVLTDESGTGEFLTTTGSAAGLTSFPTLNQNTTGSAATLTTSRNINGTAFNGSADITVTAAAGTLTGATLNSGVTASSLTSFGSSPTIVTPSITTGLTIGGAAASGKILMGNGTNYVASTPTFPTTASTSGNVITSDGTNFTSAANTGGWTTLRVTGSNATTTGTTLVDITGLVSGTLTNAALYEVDVVLYVTTSAVATGTQYAITAGGTGAASEVFALVTGTTTTNAATQVTQAASATQIGTFLTTASASGIITLKGFVLTRGSGTANISVQHLKVTSGTSTVKIGSVLRYRLAQ